MKSNLTIKLILAFTLLIVISWKANEKTFRKDTVKYGMIIPESKVLGTSLTVRIDTGRGLDYLKEYDGTDKKFKTEVDALNYIASRGWRMISVNKRNSVESTESICYLIEK